MTEPQDDGRIGALPTLPIFFKLKGRTVLLAGASEPAVWKAELLAACGARVLVCDPAPSPAMIRLAEGHPGAIRLERRTWHSEDLAEAGLAIGALDEEGGAALQAAARRAGVPVNIVDRPALCDFQFGTIVDRSPLLIAVSTDGAAPVFGQALRTRIEALLPARIGEWAQAAQAWRPDLQAKGLGFSARRRFWEGFSARAFDASQNTPGEDDRAALMADALSAEAERRGRIDCVGLGPGTPDQVTLAAVAALQSADVIVVGHDTDPALTRLGRREARRVDDPGPDSFGSTIAALVDHGQRVVAAGVGDPARCDRWIQRIAALGAERLPYTVVGGLSCRTCHAACAARGISARV